MSVSEPRLRDQLQRALEKIDRGLQVATEGRDLVKGLIESDGGGGMAASGCTDTYYEMAEADNVLKEDPTGYIQQFNASDGGSLMYIPGCCGSRTPIIHPDNQKLVYWIIVGIVFVIYECFITPYRMCFDAPAEGAFFVFEVCINIYFMIDVCMNCFIAYRNKEGQVVQSQCEIVKHYLGGWFLIDVTQLYQLIGSLRLSSQTSRDRAAGNFCDCFVHFGS
jgi:hypothetical protein